MTITRVVKPYDPSTPEAANVDELAAVLTHITTYQKSWEQNSFCEVPNGVDPLTEADIEAGVYHDFTFSSDVVEALRSRYSVYHLPVANCGTALCVAGHVAVRNGWTFIAETGEDSASRVVPTPQIDILLKEGRWSDELKVEEAAHVARDVLNINDNDSSALFAGGNNLLDLWALGYAITGGRLPLPESLPASTKAWTDTPITPELPTAEDVLDAIHLDLAIISYYRQSPHYARFVDLDRLLPLLVNDEATIERRDFLTPSARTVRERELRLIGDFVKNAQSPELMSF